MQNKATIIEQLVITWLIMQLVLIIKYINNILLKALPVIVHVYQTFSANGV